MYPKRFPRRPNSLRLSGYDYRQPGAYFITICTHQRECLLGDVQDGVMQVNRYGEIVKKTWLDLPHYYPCVSLRDFCLMPDHLHGIIQLADKANSGLPEILAEFKAYSTQRINRLRRMPGTPVWQRGYYDHVLRDDEELARAAEYIRDNPHH